MKRILLSFLMLLLAPGIFACPFCGCGGSNVYMGLMPEFRRAFMGVRYNYSQFHTSLFNDPSQFSTNYYNSIELWGGINITKKFQVLGFVPYYSNKQVDDDGVATPHGLGDITVLGQYQLFHKTTLNRKKNVVQQGLWVGGGLKVATGSFNPDLNNPDISVADINAELGTGSTDFIVDGMYNIRIENVGVNVSASYKINTVNSQHYKYGNKFSSNLIAYYRLGAKKLGISPNAGFGYENIERSLLNSKMVQYTSGNVSNAIIGIEFTLRTIDIGINGQLPVTQKFAEGQTQLRFKGMMHITVAL
ncbi:MAG TPA: hypothetical protein VG738_18865 [Chitinophagaceae bacterium]|nr:hypothetical protein [Chitinophagaceae bacterium]